MQNKKIEVMNESVGDVKDKQLQYSLVIELFKDSFRRMLPSQGKTHAFELFLQHKTLVTHSVMTLSRFAYSVLGASDW